MICTFWSSRQTKFSLSHDIWVHDVSKTTTAAKFLEMPLCQHEAVTSFVGFLILVCLSGAVSSMHTCWVQNDTRNTSINERQMHGVLHAVLLNEHTYMSAGDRWNTCTCEPPDEHIKHNALGQRRTHSHNRLITLLIIVRQTKLTIQIRKLQQSKRKHVIVFTCKQTERGTYRTHHSHQCSCVFLFVQKRQTKLWWWEQHSTVRVEAASYRMNDALSICVSIYSPKSDL